MYREIIGTNENKQFLVLNIELAAQNKALVMQAVHSGFRQPEPDFIKWNTVANDENGWEAVTDAINGEI